MSILELESVSKTYVTGAESLEVLKDLSLCVERGTLVVVSGESGSGKSTLLNLIGGLDNLSSGKILVDGRDIGRLDEEDLAGYRSAAVGFVFQFHYLLKDFTALENVMMPALIAGSTLRGSRVRAEALLRDVGLGQRLQHHPLELSGGERQRVAVARAMMNGPSLILADEPTGNLDEKNSDLVEGILFEMVTKYSKTMILVTHRIDRSPHGSRHLRLTGGVLEERES